VSGEPAAWVASLRIYAHPRVVGMLFLGFSAGLPFLLVFSTLSAWLTDYDVSRSTIGFFSWVGITYSIKVFWAPVVDRLGLGPLTGRLGKRRGWMLLAQLTIAAGLIAMAGLDPRSDLTLIAIFALIVAFGSATQDITIDAYRIEAVSDELQAAMAAMYILGYRIALLVAGAGAFYLADFYSWSTAYLVMGLLMGVGLATTLIVREPEHRVDPAIAEMEARLAQRVSGEGPFAAARRLAAWFSGAVVAPFVEFMQRNGAFALVILALVATFRLSDITMGVMANPFYLDLGFSKTEIANVTKVFGFFMTIFGSALGGILVVRLGILRCMLLAAMLVAGTNLLFAVLASMGPDLRMLAVTISADNLSAGIANVVFIAWLSSLVNRNYTATQYALFSSLMTLPGKFVGGFSGVVVEGFGYGTFFLYAAAAGIPAILLVLVVMAHTRRATAQAAA
jgi:PAT family beta-lactamase induction signal transducer AmpG